MSQNPDKQLAEVLAEDWIEGKIESFFKTVIERLVPRLHKHLKKKFTLTYEESEDCISKALCGLVNQYKTNGSGSIEKPYSYITGSVKNAALDLLRQRQKDKEIQKDIEVTKSNRAAITNDEDEIEISETAATIVFEALLDDIEVEREWVVTVVKAAIITLPPKYRLVIRHLLKEGLDYNSSLAPNDLDIPAQTFRAYKSKAYKHLRVKIPEEMSKRGIKLSPAVVPDVFEETGTFPSEISEN